MYLSVAVTIGDRTAEKNPPVIIRVDFVVSLILENLSFVSYETSTFLDVEIFDSINEPALLTPVEATLPNQVKPSFKRDPPFLM